MVQFLPHIKCGDKEEEWEFLQIKGDFRDISVGCNMWTLLGPDLNKPTVKKFMRNWGNPNTNWIFDDIKE